MSQALKYDYAFDPKDDSTAARACRLVGYEKRVLELGCAAGAMSKVLSQHYQCRVTGVEFDPQAAAIARHFCDEVIVGDLNQPTLLNTLSDSFDAVLMADVLEHLSDPSACIKSVLPHLSPEGRFVISVPNLANGGVIAALWCDAFNYGQTGLLDRTHIHFFTSGSLYGLLEENGLVVDHIEYVDAGAWHPEFARFWDQIPIELRHALEKHAPAQAFQTIMQARRPRYEGEKSIPLDRSPSGNPFQIDASAGSDPGLAVAESIVQVKTEKKSNAKPNGLIKRLIKKILKPN